MNTNGNLQGIRGILSVLESAATALRARDYETSLPALERVHEILGSRPLDAGDRMILQVVVRRLRRAA